MIYKYSSPPGFAGAERCLRVLQGTLSIFYGRVRTAEHASRDPRRILEHRHGLSEIVERGAGVLIERVRVKHPQPERVIMRRPKNASRHGQRFERQCLGICETTRWVLTRSLSRQVDLIHRRAYESPCSCDKRARRYTPNDARDMGFTTTMLRRAARLDARRHSARTHRGARRDPATGRA